MGRRWFGLRPARGPKRLDAASVARPVHSLHFESPSPPPSVFTPENCEENLPKTSPPLLPTHPANVSKHSMMTDPAASEDVSSGAVLPPPIGSEFGFLPSSAPSAVQAASNQRTSAWRQSNRPESGPTASSPPKPHVLAAGPELPFDRALQRFLWGRRLLFEECREFPEAMIRRHIQHGYIQVDRGIELVAGNLRCRRCGNRDEAQFGVYRCARCGQHCHYCRACLSMGVIKACSELLTWSGPPPTLDAPRSLKIRWDGRLSDLQQQASAALLEAVRMREDFLIWAVCGAGKTEMLYEAIAFALRSGLRVGVVAPRTDVILELEKRLKRVFSDAAAVTLYGGSSDAYADVPLILSTTHQLLRFYRRFDIFFIDEVDAFPFHANPMLAHALRFAGKDGAVHVYLSATPDVRLKRRFLNGELKGYRLPLRYHGKPLPEPRFVWIGDWKKQLDKRRMPEKLERWAAERIARGRPGFIFVPEIAALESLVPLLKKTVSAAIEGVHAEDPQRHEKVEAFRNGEIPVLATTTILERGVTVPFSDVAVYGADAPIFDERALVQIGGRVGRDARDPGGDLVFFHHGITLEMMRALRHIRMMNREGAKWLQNRGGRNEERGDSDGDIDHA